MSDAKSSNHEQMMTFLKALYGDASFGKLVLWTYPEKMSTWFDVEDLESFVDAAIEKANSQNVYFGISVQDQDQAFKKKEENLKKKAIKEGNHSTIRVDPRYVRGFNDTAYIVPGVWLDIDIKGDAHKENDLPPTLDDALALAKREFPLNPTIIVDSGHGLQTFWAFKEPWVLDSMEEREEAKAFTKRFLATIQAKADRFGWKIDSTADLARVFRLPGTFNRKPNLDPIEVKVLEFNENSRYSQDDIEQYLLDESMIQKSHTPRSKTYSANIPPAEYENSRINYISHIENGCSWMKHCKEDAETLPEPEWYRMLSILGRCQDGDKLAQEWSEPHSGYTPGETAMKLQQARENSGPVTCQTIYEMTNGAWCNGCAFKNKITSPLAISHEMEEMNRADQAVHFVKRHFEKAETISPSTLKNVKGAVKLLEKAHPETLEKLKDQYQDTNLAKKIFPPVKEKEKAEGQRSKPSLRVVQPSERPLHQTVGQMLQDAPNSGLIVPIGYKLMDRRTLQVITKNNGKTNETTTVEDIALAPVIITGLYRDINTGEESLKITWKRGGQWITRVVDRETVANARLLVSLAGNGFPVFTGNAGSLAAYLSRFEAENYDLLPKEQVSSQLGWQGKDGEYGFLWGKTLIRNTGAVNQENGSIAFKGQDFGDEQIASGFHASGTLEDWIKAVTPAVPYPKAMLAFYTAFVPPLLSILGCPNFIVDFSNRTSTGKTTIQRLAASVAGNPNENTTDSILGSWDATQVWIERASAVTTGLPLILDDTKRAKNKKMVANMLYLLANGRGRGRGNKNSLSRTITWKTVLISSGETPATSFTTDGGTRGRVLAVRGLPFHSDGDETRKLVQRLNRSVVQNYGHAFPLFIQWVQMNKNLWPTWKKGYQDNITHFASQVEGNVAGRLAYYMAAIETTGMLVHCAFTEMGHSLPWCYDSPFENLWKDIAKESEDATGEEQALRDIVGWIYSNEQSFLGRQKGQSDNDAIAPLGGWLGKWNRGDHWSSISIYPGKIKTELARLGYNPDEVLNHWKERDWLDVAAGQRGFLKRLRTGGNLQWMVTIKRSAIDEIQ